jgi:hypothetical protein
MGFPGEIRLSGRMEALGEDWRDDARYSALLRADRSIFAWEWLRRNREYREAAAGTLQPGRSLNISNSAVTRWGLHRFENPYLPAPFGRPMWTALADPFVLRVAAAPAAPGPDTFDPNHFPGLVNRFEAAGGCEHILITDGLKTIRLDVVEGRMGTGAAIFRYMPAGIRAAEPGLLSLRRLLALCKRGGLSGPLFRPETRATRWILELRVHDALQKGASQREIAGVLFGARISDSRWRLEAPTVRLQVQRLVRRARTMAEGGYFDLIKPARSVEMDRRLAF